MATTTAAPHQTEAATLPPAPWRIAGPSLLLARTVRIADLPPLPAGLRPVPVAPGRTIGGVLVAQYETPPSVLGYGELIVMPALVRRGRRVGLWVSDITVDHPTSLRGGHEIWNLPKTLTSFSRPAPDAFEVRDGDDVVLRASIGRRGLGGERGLPFPVPLAVFGTLAGDRPWLGLGLARMRASLARGITVEVPPGAPWADRGLFGPGRWLGVAGRIDSTLHAGRPVG